MLAAQRSATALRSAETETPHLSRRSSSSHHAMRFSVTTRVRGVPWSSYGSFLAFALVLTLVPGPDFAVVTKNTLASGRWRGGWSAVGVSCSSVVQGAAATAGLGAVIFLR